MKKILVLVALLFLLTGCNSDKKETSNITNDNENVIKEQVVDELKINDVSLIYDGSMSTFTANINNTSDKEISISKFEVDVKNESGNKLTTLLGTGMNIEANSSFMITITSDIDLSKAYSVEYHIVKD